jgi:hypothetical protein
MGARPGPDRKTDGRRVRDLACEPGSSTALGGAVRASRAQAIAWPSLTRRVEQEWRALSGLESGMDIVGRPAQHFGQYLEFAEAGPSALKQCGMSA